MININRNTVNRYYGIFRQLIFEIQTNELKKSAVEVEMNESYFGPIRLRGCRIKLKLGKGTFQPVFRIFERNGY